MIRNDATKAKGLPTWQVALIALVILGGLSETAYVLVGMVADACFVEDINCEHVSEILGYAFFEVEPGGSRGKYVYPRGGLGLPGFSNAFHFVVGTANSSPLKSLLPAAISVIVGFLMIAGFLSRARGGRLPSKLGLAIVFATGWFLLYNLIDMLIFRIDVSEALMQRYPEIPVSAIGLLIVSLFVRRTDARSSATPH